MTSTRVLDREIPVREGPRSMVTFTGGARGPHEAGRYAMWTGVQEVDPGGAARGYTIRSLEHLEPGERDDYPPGDPRREDMRQGLLDCLYVKPASVAEIESWLQGHKRDAAFATEAEVGGQKYRVADGKLEATKAP